MASRYAFLWVLRLGMVGALGEDRACMVPRVAQRDVRRHRAVDFLRNNSILIGNYGNKYQKTKIADIVPYRLPKS